MSVEEATHVDYDEEVIDQATGEVTNPTHVYDGLLYSGQLVRVRPINRKSDGTAVPGMCNVDFRSSRGEQSLTAMRQIKTLMGAFDKSHEYNVLTHPDSVGKYFVIAIGEVAAGGFTNFVPIFVKEA